MLYPRLYTRFQSGSEESQAVLPSSNAALHAGLLILSNVLFDSGLSIGFGLSSPLVQATRIDAPGLSRHISTDTILSRMH